MPVRNEARYIAAAIASVRRQSLTDWELVVVDDGSTDGTGRLLRQAADDDCRIRAFEAGGGLVAALNRGLSECRAPLLARMDGDDISHPHRLKLQADFLDSSPHTDLVACRFRHFPRQTLKSGMLAYESWQNTLIDHDSIMHDLFVESPFVHPSVMLRTDALKRLGGYRECGWPEDYDLWLRMAASGSRFARLDQQLFFWRDHPERATRTMDEYSLNAFRSCKCHHLVQGFLKECDTIAIAGAGSEGRAWRRILEEHGIRVTSWIDVDPRKIGRELHGAPVRPVTDLSRVGTRIIAAIGVRGARNVFRQAAAAQGLVELQDYICVS